jgi:lysyl endopeptidase
MKNITFSLRFVTTRRCCKLMWFLGLNLLIHTIQAQVYTLKVEPQEIHELLSLKTPIQIPTFELDGFSEAEIKLLQEEDKKLEQAGQPPRVAVPLQTRINTSEHGVWTESHGQKLWLLEIKARNAQMLAPVFNPLNLEKSATIWMFTKNKTLLMGPIMADNIPQKLEKVATDFLPDDAITIAYFTENEANELSISRMNYAFSGGTGFNASLDCSVDITSPAADCFKFEQNAVAILLMDDDHSSAKCTGTIINNTAQDFRPLLLSANHCFSVLNPSSMRVRFRWQSGLIVRRLVGWWPFRREVFSGHLTFIGATMLANSDLRADFALLQLSNNIFPAHQITYLGWDRNSTPQNSAVLSHPRGDLMKFARDAQPAVAVTHLGRQSWQTTLFQSGDVGLVDGGSSGAAFLNENHVICGQVRGANAFPECGMTTPFRPDYGRLGTSFTGDNQLGTRLSDFLTPNGATATSTNALFSLDGNTAISCIGVPQTVSAPSFTTSNGTTYRYVWTTSSNLTISGSGSQIQVTANAAISASNPGTVRCEVFPPTGCGNMLLGRSNVHTIEFKPTVKVLYNGVEASTVTFVSLNQSYTFRASLAGATAATTFTWAVTSNTGNAIFFTGSDFFDVNFRARGSVSVTLTATTGTCVQTRTFAVVAGGYSRENGQNPLIDVQMYPNPATAQDFVIMLPQNIEINSPVWIELKDINGKTIRQLESKERTTLLNIENIPNGLYLISIQTGDATITKKLTIQH